MGNKKQNYVIGATISAIAVVLAFASMIPTIQETPTSSTALNALGHATVVLTDAQGNIIKYAQGDNFVLNAAINAIQAHAFAGGAGVDAKWLSLCQGTATHASTGCQGAEMNHVRVDGELGTAATSIQKTGAGAGTTTDILQVTFTIGSADSGTTFTELGLFTGSSKTQAGGNGFSIADITDIIPALGASVGLTYTVTIGGG